MNKKIKDLIQYGSAIVVLLSGIGLSVASFIVSLGQIHDSVLWFFAQCLMYAAGIFGTIIVMDDRLSRFKEKILNSTKIKEDEIDR